MVRDSENQHVGRENAVDQIVREAPHSELAHIFNEAGPYVRVLRQAPERMFHFGHQPVTESRHAPLKESRRFGEILLGFGQEDDFGHRFFSRARTRARASAAGTACVSPAK